MNIEKSLQAGTANVEQREDFRLNVLDQEVHYVQMIKKLPDNATGKERVLLGQRSDSVSINTLNYNINGVDIFPTPQHTIRFLAVQVLLTTWTDSSTPLKSRGNVVADLSLESVQNSVN
mgnify:CR=1 FL=1